MLFDELEKLCIKGVKHTAHWPNQACQQVSSRSRDDFERSMKNKPQYVNERTCSSKSCIHWMLQCQMSFWKRTVCQAARLSQCFIM